ncbi:N-acetylneuraminate 9-O-acetyltransferase-like [Dendronephthya gigantea]|uniref:N-acetylneuraminate 9-O-acetyltransferase-like n=1 Tax=Dendronephthya gigantea TaxID=151771 RepID=UPI00106D47A3|nr:N-acetylneuraminate 9-O-acetyltransferase-like [Dendronephthya gigantea]
MALTVKEADSRPEASETKTVRNGQHHDKASANINEVKTSRSESFCKGLAVVIVMIAFVYHLLRGAQEGSDSCTRLLTKGEWKSNEMWQPFGCMIHQYHRKKIKTCLKNRPLALIGDSRIRDVYYLLLHELGGTDDRAKKKRHYNLSYTGPDNVSINFFWMPEVNSSMENLFKHWLKHSVGRPSFIVAGALLWTLKKDKHLLDEYKMNFTRVKDVMNSLGTVNDGEFEKMLKASKALKIKVNTDEFPKSPVIVWKLQEPVDELQLNAARRSITVEKINIFNNMAEIALYNTSVKVFKPGMLVKKEEPSSTIDGMHYINEVVQWELDILLNRFCNAYIRPVDATCCVPREHTTQLQYNSFAVFVACTLLFLVMFCCRNCRSSQVTQNDVESNGNQQKSTCQWFWSERTYCVLKAMAKLTLIMAYFFVCDRTSIFMKEHKQYSNEVVAITLVIFLLLGAYTWSSVKQIAFLNRDQSDEWKGWAQLMILLYHYIGASKVLPFYVFIRLLVASYLFMSAYGHFTYFWKKGDFSLYRVCQVVVRINIFVVVLCLIMGRPYQFYYFVPLVTFWFFVLYVVLLFYPSVTAKLVEDDPKYLTWIAVKLLFMFTTTYLVWKSPVICRWIFSQWAIKELFVDQQDNVREWIFRTNLDRYMVTYGMFFAVIYQLSRSHGIIEDNNTKRLFPRAVSYLVNFMCFMTIMGYSIQAYGCRDKVQCNAVHSVVSFLPITAFLLLRNVSGFMRSHFSTFYAWVGKISLELFVGQYHIWLANDTKGVLVLIPEQPLLNLLVTTFVFVCACHEVNKITVVLSEALVAKDVRVMLRRLVIFIIMLFIIWWHKTHHDKGKIR